MDQPVSIEIEEVGGEYSSSLEDAQEAGLRPLADLLAAMIRSGLDNGRYIVEDGVVREPKGVRYE